MKKIVALAGSNSKESINKKLVIYTSQMLDGHEVIQVNLNDFELPIYGVDYESERGIPAQVRELSKVIEMADGFVISLAEHNGSYSAVFKNIIDWLSRINTEFWNQKPMLLMATSPGTRGGATVLQSALGSFPFLGADIIESFTLPSFYQTFSDGRIVDHSFREEHENKVASFLQAIK
ncbi:MAG: NAD(P)H-dependent oxidoreductase [Saprospiraceae bacterium]|nr:NAD(P)H-dependent oxidoreductase [Saprospiraceae bacterium]